MRKKLRYFRSVIFIVFVFCIVQVGRHYLQTTNSYTDEKVQKEYLYLLRSSEISGKVDTLFRYIDSNPRGIFNIRLENGLKFRAAVGELPKEDIPDKTKFFLYDFLQLGDSVFKPKNIDFLIVYKNNREYTYFIPTKEFHDSIFHPKK